MLGFFIMDSRIKEKLFKYGSFPLSLSYLSTQKKFYENSEGLVAHETRGQYFIMAGEPIVWGNLSLFFEKFFSDLKSKSLYLCGYYVSNEFKRTVLSNLDQLVGRSLEFEKCGTSSIIELNEWELNGAQSTEVRRALNHSVKQGFEIRRMQGPQASLELSQSLRMCFDQWRQKKGILDIKFLITSKPPEPNFWNDYEEWYICYHESEVIAYLSWLPYGQDGRYLNQMIQNPNGHRFGLDALIAESLCDFKEQDVKEVSLGLNPFNSLSLGVDKRGLMKFASYFLPKYSSEGLAYYKSKFGKTKQRPRYIFWEKEKGFMPASLAMTRASFDFYRRGVSEL